MNASPADKNWENKGELETPYEFSSSECGPNKIQMFPLAQLVRNG